MLLLYFAKLYNNDSIVRKQESSQEWESTSHSQQCFPHCIGTRSGTALVFIFLNSTISLTFYCSRNLRHLMDEKFDLFFQINKNVTQIQRQRETEKSFHSFIANSLSELSLIICYFCELFLSSDQKIIFISDIN